MKARIKYLLDTNVISETRKKKADDRVVEFLASAPSTSLYLSSLTIGELKKGVAMKIKSDPIAGKAIGIWVDGLETHFADRILNVDSAIAKLWGEWSAQRPRSVVDTLLAATAAVHGLVLVSRNESDVNDLPVKILNPWLKS